MYVVVLTAGGALLVLKAYNGLKGSDPAQLADVLFSVRQQAGVMAAICAAIYAVISALESGKFAFNQASSGGVWTPPAGTTFGRTAADVASSAAR